MHNVLINLADFHYELGLIGYDEYVERIEIGYWLSDSFHFSEHSRDPRYDVEESLNIKEREKPDVYDESIGVEAIDSESDSSEYYIKFICLGKWVFTKSDPDSYPSVPHGHYNDQNKKWPKLNPYTGRVFEAKNQENNKERLSKKEMKEIWQDEKFRSFCREMIVWYREQFPHYEFPVKRPLKLPRK